MQSQEDEGHNCVETSGNRSDGYEPSENTDEDTSLVLSSMCSWGSYPSDRLSRL